MRIVSKIYLFIGFSALLLALSFAVSYALQRQVLSQHDLVERVGHFYSHVLSAQVGKGEFLRTNKGSSVVWHHVDEARTTLDSIDPDLLHDPYLVGKMSTLLDSFSTSFSALSKSHVVLLGAKERIGSLSRRFIKVQNEVDAAIQLKIAEGYLYEQVDLLTLQELRNSSLTAQAQISSFVQLANQHLLLEGDVATFKDRVDPTLKALAVQVGNVSAIAGFLKNPKYIELADVLKKTSAGFKEIRPRILEAYIDNHEISQTMSEAEQAIGDLAEEAVLLSELQAVRTGKTSTAFAVGGVCSMLGLLLIGGLLFARTITIPLNTLTDAATAVPVQVDEVDVPLAALDVDRRDELGELANAFVVMRDAIRQKVQDLQVLNETIEEQNNELMLLDELKDEFLSNTSHELRTPISGIIGLAESMMLDDSSVINGEVRHNLGMIAQSGRRLSALINDLLDLSRLKQGDLTITKEPVNLRAVADVVIALSSTLVAGKSVQIVNNIAHDTPLVLADENRLFQIFHNLIGNAVKFTQDGTISLYATEVDGLVEVNVADTGIGIPSDALESIFVSFEQIDSAMDRRFGGAGLGLAITKHLVELHGGTIGVESGSGEGARFHFTMPQAPEGALPDGWAVAEGLQRSEAPLIELVQATSGEGKIPKTRSGPKPHILVIDDEQVNLQVFVNQLSQHGYDVTPVDNGPEGLELVEAARKDGTPFSLVLLDLMMPTMSGFEVCKRLRETYSPDELPVIMVTARNRAEDMIEGFSIGANDYITKPFLSVELIARIGIHLAIRDLAESKNRDYEELQHLRNMLNNVVDSMPSMLIGVDSDGRVTQWNMEAEHSTGKPAQNALGRPLYDVMPRLSDEMDRVRQAIETREKQSDHKRARDVGGQTQYEDVTIYPLIANGVSGAVIRIDDVTEQVNLEQMMVQSEKMMSVGGLAAGMAHEINNPLAVIIGYAHNIRKRIYSDLKKNIAVAEEKGIEIEHMRAYLSERDVHMMLDGIVDSGERAAKIVSNMLNFSRKSDAEYTANDLTKLLDKTLDLFASDFVMRGLEGASGIELIRDYTPGVPRVYCEGNEIQQVFFNLIKNGTEAMIEKSYNGESPTITCRVHQDGDMAVVEIEDNGPGMDDEVKTHIFEPFFTTKGVGKGTGLGLSVSHFIVTDRHEGAMEVVSNHGSGTRFVIKLPIDTSDMQ